MWRHHSFVTEDIENGWWLFTVCKDKQEVRIGSAHVLQIVSGFTPQC